MTPPSSQSDGKQVRISMAYYHALNSAHVGGILNYIRGLINYGGDKVAWTLWQRPDQIDAVPTHPRAAVYNFCSPAPRRKRVPEALRLTIAIWRHKAEIEEDADLLLFHVSEMMIPWLIRRPRCPVVFVNHVARQHDDRGNPLPRRLFNYLADGIAARVADKIICVSEEGRRLFLKRFPKAASKTISMTTFADDSFSQMREAPEAARARLGLPPDGKLFGFAARLNWPKLPGDAIRALAACAEAGESFNLAIAGDGPLREGLEKLAEEQGIRSRVHFTGSLTPEQMTSFYAAVDATLLLSEYEGTPLSVLESLAAGRPCVVYDIANLAKIITTNSSGAVLPPGDWQGVGRAMTTIMGSLPEYQAAARQAGAQYLASRIVPIILGEICDSITSETNRRS